MKGTAGRMERIRRTLARDVRPSTRLQTRRSLRPLRSSIKSKHTPAPTRTLRSVSNLPKLTPSPSPNPTPKPYRRRSRADPWTPKRKPRNLERKPRAPPPTHFTCRICAELLPKSSFVKYIYSRDLRLTNAEMPDPCLKHLAQIPWARKKGQAPVCKSCIGQAMAARHSLVGARAVSQGCLEPGCNTYWPLEHILRYFPAGEAREKYNEDMLRIFLKESKVITCINTDCGFRSLPERSTPGKHPSSRATSSPSSPPTLTPHAYQASHTSSAPPQPATHPSAPSASCHGTPP